jgi:hypothetical protein
MLRLALLSLLLAAVLVSCAQNPYGVFASIERERKIVDERDLGNELNVASITKAGGRMFIAAGAVYARAVDGSADYGTDPPDWNSWGDAVDPPQTNYTTTSLVAADLGAGERIYAAYTSLDGNESGLYALDPAQVEAGFVGDPILSTADPGIDAVVRVLTFNVGADTWVVAVVETGLSEYAVYATNDGSSPAAIPSFTTSTPVIDVASDGATRVAYVTPKAIYVDTDGDVTGTTAPAGPGSTPALGAGARFTGGHYAGGSLWLADDAGHLYSSADFGATAWTRNSEPWQISSANQEPTPFTDFATVPRGTVDIIVVGTAGYGYREIGDAATVNATAAPTSPDVEGSNYQASELASAAVQTFFVNPSGVTDYPVATAAGNQTWDGNLLFAGTVNQGLWRALSSDEGPIQWVRE